MTEAEAREMDRLRDENRALRDRLVDDERRADEARWRAIAPE
jgi:hypothetical protein